MLVCTADYVILSLQCFPLIKGFDVQNFELLLSHEHNLACFTLVARDERRKSEVNFEAYTAFTPKHCLKSGVDYF